ncbi:hypothetical protein KC332_g9 [Hortaea werneckii]|nr:hypothetical protein KC332_g9 [Hortaea werneckii]
MVLHSPFPRGSTQQVTDGVAYSRHGGRVIVGSPLCRNTDYIKNAHMFMVEMCPRASAPEAMECGLRQVHGPTGKTGNGSSSTIRPKDNASAEDSARTNGTHRSKTSCLHQLVSRSTTSCAPRRRRSTTLEKIDSALRESLRISTFKARGLERVVVAPKGVTLPDGTHLRKGTKIGIPVLCVSTAPVPQRHKQETIRAPQPNTAMSSSSTPAKRSSHLDMGNMPAQVVSWQLMSSSSSSPTSRCTTISSHSSRDHQMPISVTSMLEPSIPSRSISDFTVLEELTDWSNGVIELKVNAQINKFLGPDSSSRQG